LLCAFMAGASIVSPAARTIKVVKIRFITTNN
jgi:hypothetical protein